MTSKPNRFSDRDRDVRWKIIGFLKGILWTLRAGAVIAAAIFLLLLLMLIQSRPGGSTLFVVDATTSDVSYVVDSTAISRLYVTRASVTVDDVALVDPDRPGACIEGFLTFQNGAFVEFGVVNGLQILTVSDPDRAAKDAARKKAEASADGDDTPEKPMATAILERSEIAYSLLGEAETSESAADDALTSLPLGDAGASSLVVGDLPLRGTVVVVQRTAKDCVASAGAVDAADTAQVEDAEETQSPGETLEQLAKDDPDPAAFLPRSEPFTLEGPAVIGRHVRGASNSFGASKSTSTFISGTIETLVRASLCGQRFRLIRAAQERSTQSQSDEMTLLRSAIRMTEGLPCPTVYQLDKQPMPIPAGASVLGSLDRRGLDPAHMTGQIYFDKELYRVRASVSANRMAIAHPGTSVEGIRYSNLKVSMLDRAFVEPWLVLTLTFFLTLVGWILGILQIELDRLPGRQMTPLGQRLPRRRTRQRRRHKG